MFFLLELLNVYVAKTESDKELNVEASELCHSSSQKHIKDKEKVDNHFHFHPGSQIYFLKKLLFKVTLIPTE